MSVEPPPLPVRSGDLRSGSVADRKLRHAADRGDLARILPGAYLDCAVWGALSERERYALRVREHLARLTPRLVASHWSAAALWGMPVADAWPTETQVTDWARRTSTRSSTMLKRPGVLARHEMSVAGGTRATTPVRTAVDLALVEGFDVGVLLFDHCVGTGLFTRDDLCAGLAPRVGARRYRAAQRAVEFASEKSQSPGESFSRVNAASRGFPPPILQEPFFDQGGKIGEVDFWWRDWGVVGEFDGDWKYTDPRFLRGRTSAQAVTDEKRRQARLMALPAIRVVVRWDYAVARNPDELARRLLAAGLPRLNPARRHEPRA